MKRNIAIVGATGIVGEKVIQILEERKLTNHKFTFFASEDDSGKLLVFNQRKFKVEKLCFETMNKRNFDFALFCTKEEVSQKYIPYFWEKGTKVIDFSSVYRHNYPLIVPEINFKEARGNLICNPNCSTIAGTMALYKIHKTFGLKEIVYSTYQAVSGAGKLALEDMDESDIKKLKVFKMPIKNNLIPQIGDFDQKGNSTEEQKMIYETKKILNDFDIKISATCVRVPITVAHSLSIHFKTKKDCSLEDVKKILKSTKGTKFIDGEENYPTPLKTREQDFVLVGRVRESFDKNTYDMFVCSDNLRKGSAQNGVQILEKFLKEG